ncbi:MAG: hypothetical protein ACYDBX_04720 [Patescibacteria group bacterium]|jgi:antitoxin component of RelBE/YafQ-DinJ toxin-antitoxin module
MSEYAVINLKTNPQIKKLASRTAKRLGISISSVLNNELKRFIAEQSVIFEIPEVPNTKTDKQISISKKQIESGDYYKFDDTKKSLDFLSDALK